MSIFGFSGGNLLRLAKRDSRLAARGSRLEARGSGSKARKIASPQLQEQAQQQAALQNRQFNMLQQQINNS